MQLFVNLLTLLHYKTMPEAAATYFNQGLLRRRSALPTEAAPPAM